MMQKETFPIVSHLQELRRRLFYSIIALIVGFGICFVFADQIFNFLAYPLVQAFGSISGRKFIFTGLAEKFFTNVKVALFASFMITFPIILSQVWLFIAPGLYKKERRVFSLFLLLTPTLFILGAMFVYVFVLPFAWKFFISFEQSATLGALPIKLESKVDEYLSLTMQMIFAFGCAFEFPLFLLLLVRAGFTSCYGLKAKRRYAILGAFFMAAILTPPDPLSQIGLAIPLVGLYEVTIFIARFVENSKGRRKVKT